MAKIAIKRLTAADLTLFQWQFKHQTSGGNQKAINLNADVFIDELYPTLPGHAASTAGRLPIDLFIYGPGGAPEYNLQRKIIKLGTYKNWRLDGEFIFNPENEPDRFNVLVPGDLVVLAFTGDQFPSSARAVFLARAVPVDAQVHAALDAELATRAMMAIGGAELQRILERIPGLPPDHAVNVLELDTALEDAVDGGAAGKRRLFAARRTTTMTLADLEEARRRAADTGRLGEEAVFLYLSHMLETGQIQALEWVSDRQPFAPYDFIVVRGGPDERIDVKTTLGEFERAIHISTAELEVMAQGNYRLFRVSNVTVADADLHISGDVSAFAAHVLATFAALPPTVAVDAISVSPNQLPWEQTFKITVPVVRLPR